MYADIEEARNNRRLAALSAGRLSHSRSSASPDLDFERPARNPSSSDPTSITERERELQDQLRRRALASRRNTDRLSEPQRGRKLSPSRSPPSVVTSRSRSRSHSRSHSRSRSQSRSVSRPRSKTKSRSRSKSRDSYRSGKSYTSRTESYRADEQRRLRRKRRRAHDRYDDEPSSRRRERDPEDDDEFERRERERRRPRSDRDLEYPSRRRAAPDIYDGSASASRYDRDRDRDRDLRSSYYDDRDRDRYYDRVDRSPYSQRRDSQDYSRRPRSRQIGRYDSPSRSVRSRRSPSPFDAADYEERSVFCSQLAARLGQRDLGEFLEEHLGQGTVKDVRIVMDKITRRSKGVGYVEFAEKELVPKAIALSGKLLFGIPILIQRTEAARNRGENGSSESSHRPPLSGGMSPFASVPPVTGAPIHLNLGSVGQQNRPGPSEPNAAARLYVGSLEFSLTDDMIKAVFEPFGEIEYVDLHREPGTGKSKGFAFIQFKKPEDAQKALEQMNGFEIAGRAIRVGNVNAKGGIGVAGPGSSNISASASNFNALYSANGNLPTLTSAFDDGGGAGLNPERRAALMEKLARIEPTSQASTKPIQQERPATIPESISKSLLLKNMFDPAEETEKNWDVDLAEDVKDECQAKYGPVKAIFVEKESAGEIYVTFADIESSAKAVAGLNGRWFGGKPISAHYIPEAFVNAKLG